MGSILWIQMKHLEDPEDPPQPINNGPCHEQDSGHAESNFNQLLSSQNTHSSGSHQHSSNCKNKSSSNRIAKKGILRAASQQNGSAGIASILVSTEGSAEALIHLEVVATGTTTTTSGAVNSSPSDNAAARLSHQTTLHQEAATQFNRNRPKIYLIFII